MNIPNIFRHLTPSRRIGSRLIVIAALTALLFTIGNAQHKQNGPAPVQDADTVIGSHDLAGTWTVTISPSDGSPSFVGYYTFFADGNASFSSAGPPIPGLGNPGYGVYERTNRNRYVALIRMNSYTEDFQFDGTLKIKAQIRMTSRNSFVTSDAVTIYDPDGNEIVVLGGAAVGRRMTVLTPEGA